MEHRRGRVSPLERVLLEKGGQRRSDDSVVVDEASIVPREPKKPTERLDGARQQLILDGLNLVDVHGNNAVLDDMAEVVDPTFTE